MQKLLKTLAVFITPLILATTLVSFIKPKFYISENNNNASDYTADNVLKGVDLERAAVFLYTDNYKSRYVLSSAVEILNPVVNITTDSFFPLLLQYHKDDLCYIERTVNLPTNSSLYSVLQKKDRLGEQWYYISCPIYVNNILVGYLSEVFYSGDTGIMVEVQKMKYYTKVVKNNLKDII